jgi:hypothetical protein
MCFSLGWLEQLLVWLVVVAAVIMILKLIVPWVASQIGVPIIGQVLNIVLWAIVVIMVIYICFALLSCLAGGGLPLLPHRY